MSLAIATQRKETNENTNQLIWDNDNIFLNGIVLSTKQPRNANMHKYMSHIRTCTTYNDFGSYNHIYVHLGQIWSLNWIWTSWLGGAKSYTVGIGACLQIQFLSGLPAANVTNVIDTGKRWTHKSVTFCISPRCLESRLWIKIAQMRFTIDITERFKEMSRKFWL